LEQLQTTRRTLEAKVLLMASLPFFATLDPPDRERLAAFARTEKVRKGTVLFRKGDHPHSLIMVIEGTVKATAPSADGREIVLNLIRSGEILGEIALFDGHPRTADAVAMTDCDLLVIDRRDFIPFVQERPHVALKIIELLCARLRRTSEQVEDVAFRYIDGRLAKILLRLRDQQGAKAPGVVIKVTQRELGNMVGMSRESINKQLMSWQKARLLDVLKGGVILRDPEALTELADVETN
jgi:CRP/FNR family cyclic AMP-dependent transcriptional regulator